MSLDPKDIMSKFVDFGQQGNFQELLETLVSSEDISCKTEISNPPAIATLKSLSDIAGEIKFIRTNGTLELYIQLRLEYMVSYKRKGRAEFVEAFKSASNNLNPAIAINTSEKEKE